MDILWELVSGPGGVNFATNQRADTDATFYVEGVFVLRLTATEMGVTVTDEVIVNVSNVASPRGERGPGPDRDHQQPDHPQRRVHIRHPLGPSAFCGQSSPARGL